MNPSTSIPVDAALMARAHALYCQLTGQRLSLGFDRERMWYELLRGGVSLEDLRQVIGYLQREIRQGRRNVGALKLSNLLQPDRFEEDLAISRVRLAPPPPPLRKPTSALPASAHTELGRLRAVQMLRQLRRSLG
jgi:hypothetical protein